MEKNRSEKGYVLSITIIVTFVLVLTTVTLLGIVFRYSNTSVKDIESLREIVKDYNGFNV